MTYHGTTILAVIRDGSLAFGGDGQVTLGDQIIKARAQKIRRLSGHPIIGGFAGATANGPEALTPAPIIVSLSAAATAPVSVDYAVTGGTATAGTDYQLAPGTLTFAAGEASLSTWMGANAFVTWLVNPTPWTLEEQLIGELCLPLNPDQNDGHPFHAVLTEVRRRARVRARALPVVPDR